MPSVLIRLDTFTSPSAYKSVSLIKCRYNFLLTFYGVLLSQATSVKEVTQTLTGILGKGKRA